MNRERKAGSRFLRSGLIVATILPLWALWVYAFMSLLSLQSEMNRLPRFYGLHLYKNQILGQLELFAKVVDQFETRKPYSTLAYLHEKYNTSEIDQIANLFGLDNPFLLVQREGFRVIHPLEPTGDLAVLLQDPGIRKDFFRTLKRVTDKESKEGYFFVDARRSSSRPAVTRWFLTVAYAGEELLCILMVPEEQMDDSGKILQSAQEALFQETLKKFLYFSLPILILTSGLVGFLCFRGVNPGKDGKEENMHDREGKKTSPSDGSR